MKKLSSTSSFKPAAGIGVSRTGAEGFTLIELITTIGIVLVLAALSLPAIGKMTEKARSTKCLNVMKQWGMGFQLYITDHDGRLPQSEEVADNVDTQWQEKIAPYLVGSDGVAGKQRFIMRARYRCPSEKVSTGIVYGGNTYLRASQYGKAPSKLVSINQKLSTFMLLGENYTVKSGIHARAQSGKEWITLDIRSATKRWPPSFLLIFTWRRCLIRTRSIARSSAFLEFLNL